MNQYIEHWHHLMRNLIRNMHQTVEKEGTSWCSGRCACRYRSTSLVITLLRASSFSTSCIQSSITSSFFKLSLAHCFLSFRRAPTLQETPDSDLREVHHIVHLGHWQVELLPYDGKPGAGCVTLHELGLLMKRLQLPLLDLDPSLCQSDLDPGTSL